MRRQHGRTGPRVVSAWTALWVGLFLILAASTIAYLVGVNQSAVVTEQNVTGSSKVICPSKDEVEIYSHVAPGTESELTSAFMKACQYQFTGTPFVPGN